MEDKEKFAHDMRAINQFDEIDGKTTVIKTGVFSIHSSEWICEVLDLDAINVNYEEHDRECPNEDHDDCWESQCSDTLLIGFVYNEKTDQYDIDPKCEYSAIVSETVIQVVRSDHVITGSMCSPCYPDQVDGDTPGNVIGYALPPDLIGFDDKEDSTALKARIYHLSGRNMLQGDREQKTGVFDLPTYKSRAVALLNTMLRQDVSAGIIQHLLDQHCIEVSITLRSEVWFEVYGKAETTEGNITTRNVVYSKL